MSIELKAYAFVSELARTSSLAGDDLLMASKLQISASYWNSTHQSFSSVSSSWGALQSNYNGISGDFVSTRNTVNTTSALWTGGVARVRDLSSGWESTMSTVAPLSDDWRSGPVVVQRDDFEEDKPDLYPDDALILVYD